MKELSLKQLQDLGVNNFMSDKEIEKILTKAFRSLQSMNLKSLVIQYAHTASSQLLTNTSLSSPLYRKKQLATLAEALLSKFHILTALIMEYSITLLAHMAEIHHTAMELLHFIVSSLHMAEQTE